jgi:tetrahydromethanopterin S-methyltransferase subunit G
MLRDAIASAVSPAADADHADLVRLAIEAAGEFVSGFAGQLVGLRIGRHVDIGDMAHGARRQPRDHQHLFGFWPAIFLRIIVIGDVPALDHGEWFAGDGAPFDGIGR